MGRPGRDGDEPVPRRGRPPLLTPEISAFILDAVGVGTRPVVAALAAGVARSTFYEWRRLGREEEDRIRAGGRPWASQSAYLKLVKGIDRARAGAAVRALAGITKAGAKDWRANKYLLEWLEKEREREEPVERGLPAILEILAGRQLEKQAGAKQILENEPQMPVYAGMRFASGVRFGVNATVVPAA